MTLSTRALRLTAVPALMAAFLSCARPAEGKQAAASPSGTCFILSYVKASEPEPQKTLKIWEALCGQAQAGAMTTGTLEPLFKQLPRNQLAYKGRPETIRVRIAEDILESWPKSGKIPADVVLFLYRQTLNERANHSIEQKTLVLGAKDPAILRGLPKNKDGKYVVSTETSDWETSSYVNIPLTSVTLFMADTPEQAQAVLENIALDKGGFIEAADVMNLPVFLHVLETFKNELGPKDSSAMINYFIAESHLPKIEPYRKTAYLLRTFGLSHEDFNRDFVLAARNESASVLQALLEYGTPEPLYLEEARALLRSKLTGDPEMDVTPIKTIGLIDAAMKRPAQSAPPPAPSHEP